MSLNKCDMSLTLQCTLTHAFQRFLWIALSLVGESILIADLCSLLDPSLCPPGLLSKQLCTLHRRQGRQPSRCSHRRPVLAAQIP